MKMIKIYFQTQKSIENCVHKNIERYGQKSEVPLFINKAPPYISDHTFVPDSCILIKKLR